MLRMLDRPAGEVLGRPLTDFVDKRDRGTSAGATDPDRPDLLEVQLRESQKTEAIRMLAGCIAHDFNNILAPILGNATLTRQQLASGDAATAALDQIETGPVTPIECAVPVEPRGAGEHVMYVDDDPAMLLMVETSRPGCP